MAVPYVPVDINLTTSAATTGNDTMQSAQYAVVYDLISEGEIQGLVDGAASIYLNGTPLTSQSTKSNITPIAVTNGVFTAGSTTVTHAAGGLSNTVGRYAILERGANTNSTFAGTSGSSRLTTTSSYFTNAMAINNQQFPLLNPKIRIDGLGPNGTEYIGTITQFVSSTAAIVEPPISTTGSSKTGARDHVSYVTAASATSITIAAAPTLSGKRFQLVPLTSSATSYASNDNWNFKDVTMNFRAGTREQTPIIYPNVPTASFLSSVEAPFLWTTGWGGNASVLNYNSTFLGLASPSEVDKLKIGIEFTGGLYTHNGEQQRIKDSFLGVQVRFQYTQGGEVKTAVILGPSTPLGPPSGRQRQRDWYNHLENYTGLIKAKIQTPFIHDIEFSVEQFKPFTDFTILISRTTPDDNSEVESSDNTHVFSARIKYIESQIVDKFRYPHSAYAVVSFPAEGFSSIPTRSYKARGIKVSVPSNYITREENVDGIARYIGSWNGTFITKYTNNPAWIFYDLATNKRYGLGKYVDSSLIDKFGLYRIARYCDELVSNGRGGLEPKFTCNVYITQAEEAYKLLRDLATTFRGMTYWAQGALMVSQDRPKEPIYTFTQGNVVDGIFNYEYSGRNARYNEINVTWTNPDQFYQQDVLTVTDQTDIIKRGRIVPMDTVAFGCTSESQAYRVALWNMITSQLETEFVSFTSGINASTLLPGDIINVQDHHLNAIQTSGRIQAAASATSITLDRNVTLTSGSTYVLHIVYDGPGCYLQQSSANIGGTTYYRGDLIPGVANSTAAAQLLDIAGSPVAVSFSPEVHVQRKTINNSLPYTGNVITVSSAFSSTPNTESVWAVENMTFDNGVAPKKYRVLSIREEPNALYTILASNYAEEKFEELEARVKIAAPLFRNPRPGDNVPPVTVMIAQYSRTTVDDLGEEVDASYFALISWTPPSEDFVDSTGSTRTHSYPHVSTYEVRYDFFDIPSTTVKEYVTEIVSGTRNSLEVYAVTPGNYEISIRVKNTIGEYSPWYTQRVTFQRQSSLPGTEIKGLKPGGNLDSGITFVSNTFNIAEPSYTYTHPDGRVYYISPSGAGSGEEWPGISWWRTVGDPGWNYPTSDYPTLAITGMAINGVVFPPIDVPLDFYDQFSYYPIFPFELVYAYNFGTNATSADGTANGIFSFTFQAFDLPAFSTTPVTYENVTISSVMGELTGNNNLGSLSGRFGDLSYQELKNIWGTGAVGGLGDELKLELGGLIPGELYQVYLWSNDSSYNYGASTIINSGVEGEFSIELPTDNYVNYQGSSTGNTGTFAVGRFRANSNSKTITLSTSDINKSPILNCFQLRRIGYAWENVYPNTAYDDTIKMGGYLWGPGHRLIYNDNEVNTQGALVYAYNFVPDDSSYSSSIINGVTFSKFGMINGAENLYPSDASNNAIVHDYYGSSNTLLMYAQPPELSQEYYELLEYGLDSGGSSTYYLTLQNLTPNTEYTLQVWSSNYENEGLGYPSYTYVAHNPLLEDEYGPYDLFDVTTDDVYGVYLPTGVGNSAFGVGTSFGGHGILRFIANNTGQAMVSIEAAGIINGFQVRERGGSSGSSNAISSVTFSNLPPNSIHYVLWDGSDTTNVLKAVTHYTDTNVAYPYGAANSYWIQAGSSNNGLITLSGSINVAQFTNKIIGTNTLFTTELSTGNLIKLHDSSNNSNAFYAVVLSIANNTELFTREIIQKSYESKELQTLTFKTNYKDDALLAEITIDANSIAQLTSQYVNTNRLTNQEVTTNKLANVSVSTIKLGNSQISDVDYVRRGSTLTVPSNTAAVNVVASNQIVVPDIDGSGTTEVPVLITYYAQILANEANNIQYVVYRTRISAAGSASADVSRFNADRNDTWQGSYYSFVVQDSVLPGTYTWTHQLDTTDAGSDRTLYDAAILVQVLKK